MSVIYEPKGRAFEYSPLACNLYLGCPHGCKYCYAPGCMRKTAKDWHAAGIPRENVIARLKRDAEKLRGDTRKILFCFLSDPYQPLEKELHLTRQALEICYQNRLKTQILTKGDATLISSDLDLMKQAKTELGITLCFTDDRTRQKWEPYASSVAERLEILKEAHNKGVYTWISLEPVIVPEETLQLIELAAPYVNYWKIGKLNHMKDVEAKVDWKEFALEAKRKLDFIGAQYYIKESLQKFLVDTK